MQDIRIITSHKTVTKQRWVSSWFLVNSLNRWKRQEKCHILQHWLIIQSILQWKIIFRRGIWRQFWPGRGRGDFKLSNLQLFDLGFRIKVLQGQFHFVFYRGSSAINDLCRNPTIPHIYWHDRFAESVFSNLFPKRETSVFFALRHAIYLPVPFSW